MNRDQVEELFLKHYNAACAATDDEEKERAFDCIRRHSKRVAKAAEEIAEKAGMDNLDTIYISGYLHDIGKFSPEWRGLNHAILGYEILSKEGLDVPARIAMTHTFYGYHEIAREDFWERMGPEDANTVQGYMDTHEMDDIDLLIQMVDNMVHSDYVMSISDRFCDILIRHKLQDADKHVRKLYDLKHYFDEKCKMNIYELFREDIIETALQEPNAESEMDIMRSKE